MATTAGSPVAPANPGVAALGAGDRVFIDTNVWVYAIVPTAPLHATARTALGVLRRAGAELWVSRQVLREYAAATTRPQPFSAPQPGAAAAADIGRIVALSQVAEDGPVVFAQFLALLGAVHSGGRQVHDANIVATVLAHGIPRLLTHNTADFARFTGYIAVIPLV